MTIRRAAGPAGLVLAGVLAALCTWGWVRYALPDLEGHHLPIVRLYPGGEEIAAFQGTTPGFKFGFH